MILYYSLCDTVKKSRPPQYCLMFQGLRHSCGAGLAIYTVEERNSLLALIYRHFNYHSKIPFEGGIWMTNDAIHPMCAAETYSFCRSRDWWRTWVSFWTEWYTPEKWR